MDKAKEKKSVKCKKCIYQKTCERKVTFHAGNREADFRITGCSHGEPAIKTNVLR